jgi:hypothetical protein
MPRTLSLTLLGLSHPINLIIVLRRVNMTHPVYILTLVTRHQRWANTRRPHNMGNMETTEAHINSYSLLDSNRNYTPRRSRIILQDSPLLRPSNRLSCNIPPLRLPHRTRNRRATDNRRRHRRQQRSARPQRQASRLISPRGTSSTPMSRTRCHRLRKRR